MKYGETSSVLKPVPELTLPDPRIKVEPLLQNFDEATKILEIHERLDKYSGLHAGVPKSIQSQFEVARNLMLYAYFVFEFQTQAELQAYAALEFALGERFDHPTREDKRGKKPRVVKLMLRELLQKAVKEKLIQPARLPSWDWYNQRRMLFAENYGRKSTPLSSKKWIESVVKAIGDLRNHIAHGNPRLNLPDSFNQIELCADIINALFRKTDE
jgi:hypothetical protein